MAKYAIFGSIFEATLLEVLLPLHITQDIKNPVASSGHGKMDAQTLELPLNPSAIGLNFLTRNRWQEKFQMDFD